jgi:tetratricopeptide (TPR) repeat protein
MNDNLAQLSTSARAASQKKNWPTVQAAATEIIRQDRNSPEGHFLLGLVEKAAQRPVNAIDAFETALELDDTRYDAAIELADQLIISRRYDDAMALIDKHRGQLGNSPRYLDMAATVLSTIGMNHEAWPLYQRANELQPDIELFQANLAACSVYVGEMEKARKLYQKLLEKKPWHQRNHYQLSRLGKAEDDAHIKQMQKILFSDNMSPEQNVYMYYAIAKEFEDLEEWDKAFLYYKKAGDAVVSVANYDFATDEVVLDKFIEVCDANWLSSNPIDKPTDVTGKTPCFILGLPRTGTTLTERIVSSHSAVQSLGETEFMEFVLRRESGVHTTERMNAEIVEEAAKIDIHEIANGYLNCVNYTLGDQPIFIDKLPYNFMYIGFIAKAFPDGKIVHLKRHPLDACFAMYKQVFTWAFKFSYDLENLGKFYIAYTRLMEHWRSVLGDRLIELSYEDLVSDQENQTRLLLDKLDLEFEEACLNFEQNTAASATASSVQVREKMHIRSVKKWKFFERQLAPLAKQLEDAGIDVS